MADIFPIDQGRTGASASAMASDGTRASFDPDNPEKPAIPDYELIRLIGRGSYGDVWLARGITGVFRAVKIIWRNRFPDGRPYEREFRGLTEFAAISLTEARQLALLHVGRAPTASFFYYVMELADDATTGREIDPARYVPLTLGKLRDDRGRLPAAECVVLGVELARALAGLHARRLVHRDIKPSNVVFVGGVPKLADIGLVAEASDGQTFIGTEGYVPPEGPGAPSADIYALGKVLYEISTGQDRNSFPRLPEGLAEIPDRAQLLELNEIIIRACDSDATRRHQDASALLSELLLMQAGRSVRRLRLAERRLGRALRVAVILGIAAIIAGVGGWIERARLAKETERRMAAEAALADLSRKTYYSACLARAQRAIEVGDLGSARAILESVIPAKGEEDLRNIEWSIVWNEASGDRADMLRDHGPPIERLALSPDGRFLAAQSSDNRTVVWDAIALRPIRTIEGTHRLAGFSSDGNWLLGGNPEFVLQRWSIADGGGDPVTSGESLHYVLGRTADDCVLGIMVDKDLSLLALREWNCATHRDVVRAPLALKGTESWKYAAVSAVSSDSATSALTLFNRQPDLNTWRLQIYDLRDLHMRRQEDQRNPISALGFSHHDRALAVSLENSNEVFVEDADTGANRWRRVIDPSVIKSLAFSPDDRLLAIGGQNHLIQVVSAQSGELVNDLRGQNGAVLDMVWSKSGSELFSAGDGGDLRRWPAPTASSGRRVVSRRQVTGLQSAPLQQRSACLSDDGSLFAATAGENRILIASTASEGPFTDVKIKGAVPLAFDRDGAGLLALTEEGLLQRWAVASAEGPKDELSLSLDRAVVVCGCISRDHQRLVAADSRGEIQFWDVARRQLLAKRPAQNGFIWWTYISPSGDVAVSAGDNTAVKVWAVATGALLAEWDERKRPFEASISGNGRWLAVCCGDGEVEIRDLTTFQAVRRWKTDFSRLESAAFSNDNRRLLCGGANGTVIVYDTRDWREVGTLNATTGQTNANPTVTFLALSAESNVLLAYREDGIVRLWHTRR